MTDPHAPVVEVHGRFADELVAQEVAESLNRWFRWILDGSEGTPPELFEPLGVATSDYAWSLVEDVDWQVGPHARVVGEEVRIAIHTAETHLHVSGLLRRLGAMTTRIVREGE